MADEVQANENAEEVKEEKATEEKAAEEKPAEETAAAETAAEEKPAGEEAPVSAPEPEKKKKINRLTMEELNKKIKKMEDADQMKSRYYKDLIRRKNEMEKTS